MSELEEIEDYKKAIEVGDRVTNSYKMDEIPYLGNTVVDGNELIIIGNGDVKLYHNLRGKCGGYFVDHNNEWVYKESIEFDVITSLYAIDLTDYYRINKELKVNCFYKEL